MGVLIVLVAGIFIIASMVCSDRKKKREAQALLSALERVDKKFDEFVDKLVKNGDISSEEGQWVKGSTPIE